MRLPFQRDPPPSTQGGSAARNRRSLQGSHDGRTGIDAGDDPVAAARRTARRRLVGAAALLGAGVVGFPLLFETEPRPLPANLPIVTAQGEVPRSPVAAAVSPSSPSLPSAPPSASSPPGRAPAARAADPTPLPAPPASSSPAAGAASAREAAADARPAAPAPGTAPAPRATAATAPAPAASAVAPSATPGRVAAAAGARAGAVPQHPGPPAAEGRYVVQVGAYSDPATLRETRSKVERLGLKTYTQVIEGDAGRRTRVRVGPFGTRAEAQAAAARLKAAGLPGNLLTL